MSERIKRQFQNFLDDQDAYDDFAYELYMQKGLSFNAYMSMAGHVPRRLIEMAFSWHGKDLNDSKGANYWSILNEKWIEYLDN